MIYFKVFPKDLIINKFKFKLGLNEINMEYDPKLSFPSKEIYYYDLHKIGDFYYLFNDNIIGIIKIPDDTPITRVHQDDMYDEYNEYDDSSYSLYDEYDFIYKSPKIDIIEFISYNEFIDNKDIYQEEKMKCKNPFLKLIMSKEQTPEICLEAIKYSGYSLRYVNKQTPEICLEAVKYNADALEYVKNQTLEMCLEAVKINDFYLRYVDEKYRIIVKNILKNKLH